MSSATHITVMPDLSGWGFVAEIDESGKEIRRGLGSVAELARYCRFHKLPAVVEGEVPQWREQTERQLRKHGVEVIPAEEATRLEELGAYWLARVEVGDRIEFESNGQLFWGEVYWKGERYLDVLPDGWNGKTFVAGREVRTLMVKGPRR